MTYSWINPLPQDGTLPFLPDSLTQEQFNQTQDNSVNPLHVLPTEITYAKTQAKIQAAIAATLPSGPGQRNRLLFDFARILKGLVPDATPVELRAMFKDWHTLALPVIRTKDFCESWADFTIA